MAKPAPPPAPKSKAGPLPRVLGRPPYQPTDRDRATVKGMAGCGVKQADVCAVLGVSHVTLRRHFKAELATGAIVANAAVSASLYRMATGGKNVAAAIWWEKTRMGYREVQVLAGDAANPVVMQIVTGVPRPSDAAK